MRVVVMVMTTVFFGGCGAAAGYFLGEYAPGGLASFGEPFSPIRDAQAEHYALIAAAVGALVGLVLGGVVRLGNRHGSEASSSAGAK